MNLPAKAAEIRRFILETALQDGKGHIPSALSWVEVAVALFSIIRPQDRFVLSKTHGHLTLDAFNLPFDYPAWSGWPYKCSGSLGQGLGMAAGMALANKMDGSLGRVYCVLGDAELHEGQVWEAIMFAAHHNLNLTAIIDDNGQACADYTRDVLGLGSLLDKFRAFGWKCAKIDGHNIRSLVRCLNKGDGGPFCLIARTVKGQGISYMAGNPAFHHQLPEGDQIRQAREDLA